MTVEVEAIGMIGALWKLICGGDSLLASLEEAYLYIFQLKEEMEELKNLA